MPDILRRSQQAQAEREPARTAVAESGPASLLDSRWELAPETKLGTFNVRGYKPVYLMPWFATSHQNALPHSPNPDNTVTDRQSLIDDEDIRIDMRDHGEGKAQDHARGVCPDRLIDEFADGGERFDCGKALIGFGAVQTE